MPSKHKTQGIVIHSIKYKESSLIVKVYTEMFGLQSYIVNGVRKSKSKQKMALYQPLTLLDMVVYYQKDVQKLFRISELRCWQAYKTIPADVKKITVAFFLTEILHKCLKEETAQEDLFFFLRDSLIIFDEMQENYENFHLYFLMKLSKYLGFTPENPQEIILQISRYKLLPFETEEEQEIVKTFLHFLEKDYKEAIKISGSFRSLLIDLLMDFYRLHIENFDNLKSLEVLRETMQ